MPCLSSSAVSALKESIRVSNAESQLALPLAMTTFLPSSVIGSPKGSAACAVAGAAAAGGDAPGAGEALAAGAGVAAGAGEAPAAGAALAPGAGESEAAGAGEAAGDGDDWA